MLQKSTLIVDVDQTVADLMPAWIGALLEACPDCPDPRLNQDWDNWDIVDHVPEKYRGKLFEILGTHALYDNVKPLPGALDGIRQLQEIGHRVVFATSCVVGHAGAKLVWLARHGFVASSRHCYDYAECSDKTLIRGRLIIDDRPRTCHAFRDLNGDGSALLFMQREIHHKYRRGLPYARNWPDTVMMVGRLLEYD